MDSNANLSGEFLVSYDAPSPITNISLQETIKIAINHILNKNTDLNITKKEFKELFVFTKFQTHFISIGTFYKQIAETAIGFPLAPVLDNILFDIY